MSKTKKRIISIVCVVAILAGAVFGIMRHRERVREMEQRMVEESYLRVQGTINAIMRRVVFRLRAMDSFHPLPEVRPETNRFGIEVHLYLFLKFYERETGNVLTYETLVDFFSEEFETDGSLRLYNNGKHPEMQVFVEWVWEEGPMGPQGCEWDDYFDRIWGIYRDYLRTHPQEFKHVDGHYVFHFQALSPQMLDALARAEADPNYMLDLTSLQRAGY